MTDSYIRTLTRLKFEILFLSSIVCQLEKQKQRLHCQERLLWEYCHLQHAPTVPADSLPPMFLRSFFMSGYTVKLKFSYIWEITKFLPYFNYTSMTTMMLHYFVNDYVIIQ